MEGREVAQQAKRIFELALQIPAPERSVYLETACLGDMKLRDYVLKLFAEFERASDNISSPIETHRSEDSVAQDEFKGTSRFSLARHIGAGAFGSVFQVWDREQRSTVALKLLRSLKPEALFRFKKEFRSLAEVRHENLVQLYELFWEDTFWFFTMEFVDGLNFLEYIRPKRGSCDFDRLRASLAQLIRGVNALHQSNCIHRDLKPGNVLVARDGRVIVLDFGLVREISYRSPTDVTSLVGTPAYMSPEQMIRKHVSPASDWYSVGVMLFQALTGNLPYEQSMAEMWARGKQSPTPCPRLSNAQIPEDLNRLCCELLERLPERRPNAEALLSEFATANPIHKTHIYASEVRDDFVGREEQLHQLEKAFSDVQEGRLNVVLIEGASGIGKSALINRFLIRLAERSPNVLALKGRCYEFESVPYKGMDALIDELTVFLKGLSESEIQPLLPRDSALLPKLFPVLGRISSIASAPARLVVPDEQELRQRTFAALRELFARIADRQPVVLWIDDFQWADRDSSTLLADLCTPPQHPPMLMLLSYRSEEVSSNPTLQYLRTVLASHSVTLGNWHHLTLRGLEQQESKQLLRQLVGKDLDEGTVTKIATEADGHPLFIRELAMLTDSSSGPTTQTGKKDVELQGVLRHRISGVDAPARELLELICIAAQPQTPRLLLSAAESSSPEERSAALPFLIRENLARVSGSGPERKIEPFHDQVRDATLGLLSGDLRRVRHRQLATALEAEPGTESQSLVTHYREAGDLAAAYKAALAGAAAAESQLAFDRAAGFYATALELGDIAPSVRAGLYSKLADALGKAGRGRDSAKAYVQAALHGGEETALEMKRLAADQYMRSGYIEEGMSLFRELSKQLGIKIPRTPAEAIAKMAIGRFRTRSRLLFPLPDATTRHASDRAIARLEILRTGGVLLNIVDPVTAAYFQVRYVAEAIKHSDPRYLPVALALEAGIRAAVGTRHRKTCFSLLNRAQELAVASESANVQGLVYLARAYVDYLLLLIPEGLRDSVKAIEFLRTYCTGVAWELTTSYVLLFWFKCWAGELSGVRELHPQLLKEGASRGDVNVEVSLQLISYVHFAYLASDEPQKCLDDCGRALRRWQGQGFTLQHYGAMFTEVETHLYNGAYELARETLLGWWKQVEGSFILRWRVLTVMALFLRGRVALACWLDNRSDSMLRREVEHYAKRLERIRCDWCAPMVCALRAGLAAGLGRRKEAVTAMEAAYEGFEESSLHGFASAAAYKGGKLRGDLNGQLQVEMAEKFMKSERVRNPEAFMKMLLPGKWT